jgi:hypothetical protein
MSVETMSTAMALLIPLLIPVLAVTVSLGALIVWIVAWHRRKVLEADCRHKERMAAIEKGLELPPDSLPQLEQTPPRSRYLLRGLIWLGVGLAITFGAHGLLTLPRLTGFGWIPIAVGAAYLIFYFVEGRNAGSKREESASGDHQAH